MVFWRTYYQLHGYLETYCEIKIQFELLISEIWPKRQKPEVYVYPKYLPYLLKHRLYRASVCLNAASFILSRLDYCNALYKNLNKCQIEQIQKLQNFAAKVVLSKTIYDHVTPCLIELHWLPVSYRINYKISVLTFKCLYGLAPEYLSDLIEEYQPTRQLRSANQKLLTQKVVKYVRLGEKSFSFSAPEVWNKLPFFLRNEPSFEVFKKKLKTYYFNLAFQ